MKLTTEERYKRLKKSYAVFLANAQDLMKHLGLEVMGATAVRPRIRVIQETVAEFYGLPIIAMTTAARPRRYAQPRQVAMMMVRELTNLSLEEIGAGFGGRDHGTIIHAAAATANRLETEEGFTVQLNTIRQLCRDRLEMIDMPIFHQPQEAGR